MVKPTLIALGLLAAFILSAIFVPADPLTEILSAGVFIASCFGLWRWTPAAWRNFASGANTETAWGLIGVVVLLLALAIQRVYSVFYIALDRPEALTVLHVSPFITYLVLIALVLFIAATKFQGEHPTKITGLLAAVIAFFGVLLSSALPYFVAKFVALGAVLAKIGVIVIPH